MVFCKQYKPVFPEADEKGEKCSGMKRNIKGECVQLSAPFEKPRKQDQVGSAADRKELCQALNNS